LALNILQLRLFHHYTTVTAKTLGSSPDAYAAYATSVPQAAFEYPFLLQSVLALAALHLSRLEEFGPEAAEYALIGDQYYEAALSSFQATVRDIDGTNFQGILMFAGLMFPYSCASSIDPDYDVDYAFDLLLSNLSLTRRMRPLASTFYNAIKASVMDMMIPDDIKGVGWTTQEPPVETELVQLRKFAEIVHHLYPPEIVDAYSHAVHLLVVIFAAAEKSPNPPSDGLLKIWTHFVTERYVELLSERQPGSLIIYAHYAVLIQRSSVRYWFLAGLSEQILRVAEGLLPSEWSGWLDWPKEQLRGGRKILTLE
jgi:hypothetical protein